ncbi:PHP domain-containing protein [Candidatus Sumerlaeota bacterium]|nr:PHP domain-containing protein [Candidatus Sumerlaeota bacterium]
MRTDLHLHSWVSDGLLSPDETVRHAKAMGVELMALTDHDTMGGLADAEREAKRLGIKFVPGVEMTVGARGEEIHILGYLFERGDTSLEAICRETRGRLRERLAAMIERLRERHRFETSLEEVLGPVAHSDFPDRPHLARLMVEQGFVGTFEEAFARHLGQEGDCYLPLVGVEPAQAIGAIRSAGGIAVLAHPRYFNMPEGGTVETIRPLVDMGLGGIEVYHSRHSEEEIARFTAIAEHFDLVVTGGTDCHGVRLEGDHFAIENRCVPDGVGEAFLERCADLRGARALT